MPSKILITGAAGGIGLALCRTFATAGYQVYAQYHTTQAPLWELSHELALQEHVIVPLYADITNPCDIQTLVAEVGTVTVLVNNAGISQFMEFTQMSLDDWQRMLQTNLTSAFLTSQCVLPAMLQQHNGCIINIASIWGMVGSACEVHYSAAKAGLIGFTKALAKEMAPSGIRVNAIAPGVIDTPMNQTLTAAEKANLCDQTPLGQMGSPIHVANAVHFLAEQPFITGEILNISGGFVI